MKAFLILIASLILTPAAQAQIFPIQGEPIKVHEFTVTPKSSSPAVVNSDLILNPGQTDETKVTGPWFVNSYTVNCADCIGDIFVDTLNLNATCESTDLQKEYVLSLDGTDNKAAPGEGFTIGSAYFASLPECAPKNLKITVEVIGYDSAGDYIIGSTVHGVQ